jgi:septum site-determining protein MinC
MKQINFKGVKDGIILDIKADIPFEDLLNKLQEKAKRKNKLLENASLIGMNGPQFNYQQKAELEQTLENLFKINVLSLEKFNYNSNKQIKKKVKKKVKMSKDAKFVKKTIRSGEKVVSENSVVILGDVNPGALIKAEGNIVVLGALRGIAHAGYKGNEDAFIAAFKLDPNQLRIASSISRSPDGFEYEGEIIPEIAFIKNDRIIIEKL